MTRHQYRYFVARTLNAMAGIGEELDRGGALLHLYTDLVQHLGQLEIIRDILNERGATS